MQKRFVSQVALVAFIIVLAIVPVVIVFMPHKSQLNTQAIKHDNAILAKVADETFSVSVAPRAIATFLSPTSTPAPTVAKPKQKLAKPTPTSQPKPVTPDIVPQVVKVTDYQSNTLMDNAFSFSYPADWKVVYEANMNQKHSYVFTLSSGNISQVMTVSIFNKASSVDSFIQTDYATYKDFLAYTLFGPIGNNTLYSISPKATVPTSNLVYSAFGTRGVILGNKHAYTVSFDENSDQTMIAAIEKKLWPTTVFK